MTAHFGPDTLTLHEATQALTTGALSAQELTAAYIHRIEALDHHVNAVIALDPRAMDQARQCDQQRRNGVELGALHGVPLLIKDNIDVAGGLATTAGSLALAGTKASADASVISRLRRAGAIVLGKTNLSEWANFRSTRSSTGWSSVGGQTGNAFDPNRSPGGSSSGSGVAVAMGFCTAALGTETDGSVVIPSSMNSLAGIKPSIGLVSRTGIVPIAHSQDTAGPMTRTVADAALLLSVMIGYDEHDPASVERADIATALESLPENALRGARVGIDRTLSGCHPAVDAIVDFGVTALRDAGTEVIDGLALDAHEAVATDEHLVLLTEFKADLEAYLATRDAGTSIRTLGQLIEFNNQNADQVMPYFGQELFLEAQTCGGLDDADYLAARARSLTTAGPDGIDTLLQKHQLDALFGATVGPPWSLDLINGDHRSPCWSTPAAVAGYPHVTVPGGFVHGLPVGVSFVGARFNDARMAAFAHAFESQTQFRRAPEWPI